MQELCGSIKKLKSKKAPGPDGVMNDMLRHLGSAAMNVLLGIFNPSWKQGRVPDIWKEASIMPIHKKGKDKKDAKSYCPISHRQTPRKNCESETAVVSGNIWKTQ